MLIQRLKEIRKFNQAHIQPFLPFIRFSGVDTLETIRTFYFPDLIGKKILFYFVKEGTLACICPEEETATIYFHNVLNDFQTPVEVFSLIFKHELLHLRIPPQIIGGRKSFHSPEFWQAEEAIAPERTSAWSWIWINLATCLKRRNGLERIDVLPNWKHVWGADKLSISECEKIVPNKIPSETLGW